MRPPTFTAPPEFTTRPTLEGTFGMSASTHWLATASAQAVLERGGNAFDAAVAGGFVLHVVEPHLNGPGGDLVGIFATAADPATPVVLMGQGPAPAGASIEHFRGEGLTTVPGAGGLAAAVPGAVDAWLTLLRDHGTWELGEVLSFAIGYARSGHPLSPTAAAMISRVGALFTESWPSSAQLWMPEGTAPAAGTIIRNPAYADVLDELVAATSDAPDRASRIDAALNAWRHGRVAHEASAFLARPHRHSDGRDHAGVIAPADFAAFEAGYEPAVSAEVWGHTVAKAGAWTQGPALLQTLLLLEGLGTESIDPSTAHGARHRRGAQARVRRPRRVLRRRVRRRRCARRRAAGSAVHRRAPRPDRPTCIARLAARRGGRARGVPPAARVRPARAGCRRSR